MDKILSVFLIQSNAPYYQLQMTHIKLQIIMICDCDVTKDYGRF